MFKRIIYRFEQFLFALNAKMTEADKKIAKEYLTIKEKALFEALPEFEQKHSVVVAQKMQHRVHGKHNFDERKVIRLGLLHDIGKAATRLTIVDKGILVALNRLCKPLYNYFATLGENDKAFWLFRKFYVYKHHGEIGGQMLKRINEEDEIITYVVAHDTIKFEKDDYLKLLIEADSSL